MMTKTILFIFVIILVIMLVVWISLMIPFRQVYLSLKLMLIDICKSNAIIRTKKEAA